MNWALNALVLPPEHILRSRVDTVTQDDVSPNMSAGILFTLYLPVTGDISVNEIQLNGVFSPAFRPYQVLQRQLAFAPITYVWKSDVENQVWEAVVASGPEEYVRRAKPYAQITTNPSAIYLDKAPKEVAIYRTILRPKDATLNVEKIDTLLISARSDARINGLSNALFSVNVQGVEPKPKNDLADTLAVILATTAITTAGVLVIRAATMRLRP